MRLATRPAAISLTSSTLKENTLPRTAAPKPSTSSRPSASNEPHIPRPTPTRAPNSSFCIGRIAGRGIEEAHRISELVIEQTAPAPVEEGGE